MSSFFFAFFVIDQILIVGAVLWLIFDGAWIALALGILFAFGVALALALSITFASFFAAAAANQLTKNRKFRSYALLFLYAGTSAFVLSYTFGFVVDYFKQFSDEVHPVALIVWSYVVTSAALTWIVSSDYAGRSSERVGGLFAYTAKISFILHSAVILYAEDEVMAMHFGLAINFVGLGLLAIHKVNTLGAKQRETQEK